MLLSLGGMFDPDAEARSSRACRKFWIFAPAWTTPASLSKQSDPLLPSDRGAAPARRGWTLRETSAVRFRQQHGRHRLSQTITRVLHGPPRPLGRGRCRSTGRL